MTIDTKRLATDAAYWRECGAPEWATHFDTAIDAFCNWKGYEGPKDGKYHGWGTNRSWHLKEFDDQFIPRPRSEWVNGLPGVGCECEVLVAGWERAYVVGYNSVGKLLIEVLSSGMHIPFPVSEADVFRPIKTKAQRDRDELKSIIADFEHYGHDYVTDKIIAAGWTKP